MEAEILIKLGFIAILLGVFLITLGIISHSKKSRTEAGFVAFIGPIPIGFATSREALLTVFLITLVVLLMIGIYYFYLINLLR